MERSALRSAGAARAGPWPACAADRARARGRGRAPEHRRAAAAAAVAALLPGGEAARELGHALSSPLGVPPGGGCHAGPLASGPQLGLSPPLLRNGSIPKRRRSGPVRLAAGALGPATPGSAPSLGRR